MGRLRFGFACIPLALPQPVVRACRLENASPARLRELIDANLASLDACLDYVAGLGLELFRVNSGVIPFASHPVNAVPWWRERAADLAALGAKAARHRLRLSMHPGQYTVLNSPSPTVTANAVAELEYHARFLDSLGAPTASKVVVHLGGVYGDRAAARLRLEKNWKALSPAVRRRLVLENDENLWSIYDALEMGERLGAPVVFDRFHHRVHGDPTGTPVADLLRRAIKTWRKADGRPKAHFSSQAPGERPGTHGEGIDAGEFKEFLAESEGLSFDVMIEARAKEGAALEARRLAAAAGRTA
ncbi:MAG: UV DNA damage repair endonuclease UvsE [Elusimicrobiota bacterium]|nr:UV DNA damage repair endonuclease UvsE [Elusimicrobiota bacterium]